MPTLRKVVSDIVGDLKANNLDDRLSYRFVISKLRDKANYFFKQDSELRKVFKVNEIWKAIRCFDLEDYPITSCPIYLVDSCKTIKRSVNKIPKTYSTNYGNAIKVLSINNGREFKQIKAHQYGDYKWNPYAKNFFWIEDDYLWFPDTDISFVKILGIFEDTTRVDILNGDADECISPLDGTFDFPPYIITIAKQELLKEFFSEKSINQDENPNQNNIQKQ